MTFKMNAAGHQIVTHAGVEEVSREEWWAKLKRQVAAMPHNR